MLELTRNQAMALGDFMPPSPWTDMDETITLFDCRPYNLTELGTSGLFEEDANTFLLELGDMVSGMDDPDDYRFDLIVFTNGGTEMKPALSRVVITGTPDDSRYDDYTNDLGFVASPGGFIPPYAGEPAYWDMFAW